MGQTEKLVIRKTIRRHQLREMVPLADSAIYEMKQRGESPGASLSFHAASCGTLPKSRLG